MNVTLTEVIQLAAWFSADTTVQNTSDWVALKNGSTFPTTCINPTWPTWSYTGFSNASLSNPPVGPLSFSFTTIVPAGVTGSNINIIVGHTQNQYIESSPLKYAKSFPVNCNLKQITNIAGMYDQVTTQEYFIDTGCNVDTPTYTNTPTPTNTPTLTNTRTPTITDTPIFTYTDTNTPTVTNTFTSTFTYTVTNTRTNTVSPTDTYTATNTRTPTNTFTVTDTMSPTDTFTTTNTPTETNTPTTTYTPSDTPTITPTAPPFPYVLRIAVYNQAGEMVRLLADTPASKIVGPEDYYVNGEKKTTMTNLDALSFVFTGLETPSTLGAGVSSFFWYAQNSADQTVENGVYYLKVEQTDAYNHTTSYVKSVTVMRTYDYVVLSVFNSAGETVRMIRQDRPMASDKVTLSVADPVYVGEGGSGKVIISYGTDPGDNVSWDGKNEKGIMVNSGNYEIQIIVVKADGKSYESSKTVTVLRNEKNFLKSVKAYPNPVKKDLYGARNVVFIWDASGETGEMRISIYNISGERVRMINTPLEFGGAFWGLETNDKGTKASYGIYICMFEATSESGQLQRKKLKLAVME